MATPQKTGTAETEDDGFEPEDTDEEEMSLEERVDQLELVAEALMGQISSQDWAMGQMMKGVVVLMGQIEAASDPEASAEVRMAARDGAKKMLNMMRKNIAQREDA